MPPRKEAETKPSQSVSAWYGKLKPRVCTPDPSPQVLQQQVRYNPRKKKNLKYNNPSWKHNLIPGSTTRL